MAEAAYMIIDSKFFPWLFCRWKFFWSWSTKARTVPLILNDIWMLKVIANATTNRTWYHCKLHLENKNCPQPQKSWRHHCNNTQRTHTTHTHTHNQQSCLLCDGFIFYIFSSVNWWTLCFSLTCEPAMNSLYQYKKWKTWSKMWAFIKLDKVSDVQVVLGVYVLHDRFFGWYSGIPVWNKIWGKTKTKRSQ